MKIKMLNRRTRANAQEYRAAQEKLISYSEERSGNEKAAKEENGLLKAYQQRDLGKRREKKVDICRKVTTEELKVK